jgi:hypothetical protein
MSIVFYGESMGGRAVGRPRTAGMSSRDPLVAARYVKSVAEQGKWRSLPGRDAKAKILTAVSNEARWALLALPADAVEALAAFEQEDLSQVGCRWCALRLQRLPAPDLERNEAALVVLGHGCQACQRRWARAEATAGVAAREHGDLTLIAGGQPLTTAIRGLARARRVVGQAGQPSRY